MAPQLLAVAPDVSDVASVQEPVSSAAAITSTPRVWLRSPDPLFKVNNVEASLPVVRTDPLRSLCC